MNIPKPYTNLILGNEDNKHWFFHCCFHSGDNTASLVVNKFTFGEKPYEKYLYYKCFACGRCGTAEDFAMLTNQGGVNIAEKISMDKPAPKIDWKKRLQTGCCPEALDQLSEMIGVSLETIEKFNIGWNPNRNYTKSIYLIPMYNENGICGIQERWYEKTLKVHDNTYYVCKKKCQRYSKHGIFQAAVLGASVELSKTLYICEGFSDTTVVTECGFSAIGRFNALSISNYIINMCNQNEIEFPVVIVADTDDVGIKGAKKLQQLIPRSKVLIPVGYPDIRALFLDRGKEFTKCFLTGEIYL